MEWAYVVYTGKHERVGGYHQRGFAGHVASMWGSDTYVLLEQVRAGSAYEGY